MGLGGVRPGEGLGQGPASGAPGGVGAIECVGEGIGQARRIGAVAGRCRRTPRAGPAGRARRRARRRPGPPWRPGRSPPWWTGRRTRRPSATSAGSSSWATGPRTHRRRRRARSRAGVELGAVVAVVEQRLAAGDRPAARRRRVGAAGAWPRAGRAVPLRGSMPPTASTTGPGPSRARHAARARPGPAAGPAARREAGGVDAVGDDRRPRCPSPPAARRPRPRDTQTWATGLTMARSWHAGQLGRREVVEVVDGADAPGHGVGARCSPGRGRRRSAAGSTAAGQGLDRPQHPLADRLAGRRRGAAPASTVTRGSTGRKNAASPPRPTACTVTSAPSVGQRLGQRQRVHDPAPGPGRVGQQRDPHASSPVPVTGRRPQAAPVRSGRRSFRWWKRRRARCELAGDVDVGGGQPGLGAGGRPAPRRPGRTTLDWPRNRSAPWRPVWLADTSTPGSRRPGPGRRGRTGGAGGRGRAASARLVRLAGQAHRQARSRRRRGPACGPPRGTSCRSR